MQVARVSLPGEPKPCQTHLMHLEYLEIVNFRGISRLCLDLEAETTVLFGENAWGKTSLVEALSSTLGDRPLTEADFHRLANTRSTIAQRMGITLRFGGDPDPELEGLGWRDEAGAFHLSLHWAGRRLGRGRIRIRQVFLGQKGREIPLPEVELAHFVDKVVRSHPLHVFRELRLADWMLEPAMASGGEAKEAPEQTVQRVFERLLAIPHQVHPEELGRGLQALNRLAEQRPELFKSLRPSGPQGLRRAQDMAEVPLSLQDGRSLADLASKAGAGMRQVALLVLIGGMLKAESGSPRIKGALPLLLVEDPETHLHPIQLATAWGLMEQMPAQKLVTSAHGALLAGVPTRALRRLVRRPGFVQVFPEAGARGISREETRRVAFHVRTHHADSLFARVWLLVEGETESWLLPELARVGGLGFPLEGIHCVAFAQSGLAPLIAFADRFGIAWHLIADGDEAGQHYRAKARRLLRGRPEARHLTVLPDRDMEHFLWRQGFADVYLREAVDVQSGKASDVIQRALRIRSKPGMALEVAEEAGRRGPSSLPPLLRRLFSTLRRLAQQG